MTFKLAQAAAALAATSAIGAGSMAVLSPLDRPATSAQAAESGSGNLARGDVREVVRAASRLDPGEVNSAAIKTGAVGSDELAAGAVGSDKLATDAVTSDKVLDGSLQAEDFGDGELPAGPAGERGETGAVGARGERGPTGFTGAAGPVGPAGLRGLTGGQGPRGVAGPPGPQGIEGLVGPQGPAGPPGVDGAPGPQGIQGLTGSAGPAGAPGATGSQGAMGATGATGAAGPQGPAGPTGDPGPQGSTGPQGATGPQGPPGANGLSSAREVYRDGDQDLPDGVEVTMATMSNVEPGSYAVFAKTTVVHLTGGDGHSPYTHCTLDTGGTSTDYAESDPQKADRSTLQTEVLATFPSTGTITLRCIRDSDKGTYVARGTKIIAIKLDSVVREAVGG